MTEIIRTTYIRTDSESVDETPLTVNDQNSVLKSRTHCERTDSRTEVRSESDFPRHKALTTPLQDSMFRL